MLPPRARLLLPLLAALLLFFTVRTLFCTAPESTRLRGETMGSTWSVVLAAPPAPEARTRLQGRIQHALESVSAAMSNWDETSELSRLNADVSGRPFALSAQTFEVLRAAQEVSAHSGGAFDVTVAPLVQAYGFGPGAEIAAPDAGATEAVDSPGQADSAAPGATDADTSGPDAAPPADSPGRVSDAGDLTAPDPATERWRLQRERARRRVDYRGVALDLETRSVQKRPPDLEIDLSAIAKGYAVDRVSELLHAAGHRDFLVEVGGELRASGERPGGGPWRVAIERPEPGARVIHAVAPLADQALATSGDYRNFRVEAGERRSHLVDPRRGAPISGALASVSVMHESAMWADAWATALMVLGPEAGLRLAEQQGLAVYMIVRSDADARFASGAEAFRELRTAEFPPTTRGVPAVQP